MTNPLPNMQAALADVKDKNGNIIGKAYVIPPWNSFFQQSIQTAPAAVDVILINPFQANANGTIIIKGAAAIIFTRGQFSIDLTGNEIIPISIGDIVAWAGATTVNFLGA